VTRPTFFFYVLPLTPFMVLAITYVCRQASDATIVVRDRETRDVAINPQTGEPAISHAYVYRTVRRRVRDRGGRGFHLVLAGTDRGSHQPAALAHDRVVQRVDLSVAFAPR
jgi:hypothetical protein